MDVAVRDVTPNRDVEVVAFETAVIKFKHFRNPLERHDHVRCGLFDSGIDMVFGATHALVDARRNGLANRKQLAELLAYFDSLPKTNEHLSDEEIIGYDEQGLPK